MRRSVEYSALLADCLFAVTFELIDYCVMTIASCMILKHSVPCAFCECVLRLCSLLLLINKIYPDNSAYFRAKSTANMVYNNSPVTSIIDSPGIVAYLVATYVGPASKDSTHARGIIYSTVF